MFKNFDGSCGNVIANVRPGMTTVTATDKAGKVLDVLNDKGHPSYEAIAEVVKGTEVCPIKVAVSVREAIRCLAYPC
jgi:hypothetical protein